MTSVGVFQMLSIILMVTLCGRGEENTTVSSFKYSQTNVSQDFHENTQIDTQMPFANNSTNVDTIVQRNEVTNKLTTQMTNSNDMESFNNSHPHSEFEIPHFPSELGTGIQVPLGHVDAIHQPFLQVETCGVYCDNSLKVHISILCGNFTCPYCRCDEQCSVYGDCCPDINGTVFAKQHREEEYVCVSHWENFAVNTNFYMIKSCPTTMETAIKYNDVLKPVTSKLTNKTYYNENYALCHNEHLLTVWDDITFCSSYYYENYENATEEKPEVCQSLFEPPRRNHDLRTCSTHYSITPQFLISRCNDSGRETEQDLLLERLCESSDYRVEIHGAYYRNIFCALCNGEPKAKNCTGVDDTMTKDNTVTINDLIMFDDPKSVDKDVRNCTDMEWSEPNTFACYPILCLQGRYYKNGECKMDNHTIEKTEYTFEIDFHVGEHFPLSNWTDVVQMFVKNVPVILSKFDPLVYVFTVDNLYDLNEDSPSSFEDIESLNYTKAIRLSVTMRSVGKADVQEYEDYIRGVIWSVWVFRMYGVNIIFTPRQTHRNLVSRYHAMFFYFPLHKSCCSDNQYFDWLYNISIERADFPIFAESYISLSADLECPHVRFPEGKYEIYPNHTLRLVNSNITLAEDKYRRTPFNVKVCVSNFDSDDPSLSVKRQVEMYLSIICTCISLVCIFLTLFTFLKFPVLQTLPTKITMFLAASIFVAQATFQFGGDKTENKTLCQIIGGFNHFLWLCVTFWMNVCCYHMFHVFVSSSKTTSGHGNHWRALFKYMTYVYGISSAIVATTISANYISSDGSSIGYGSHICYIDRAMVVGLAFILPLGIVIISNTIFFFCTVYTIYRIRKIEASSSSDQRNVFVYIKLSTLTGAFWILSIVAKASESDVLSIISVVLNGSQGFFLFVSYILNKRVYKLWRNWATKKLPLKPRSSTFTVSTTS